ncbi:dihydroxyacetone kinase subunit DhaL [Niveibacterium sp. SC-1]|uniref:dihydroxyacetone kinase subunit DhaL n=1 Tax=Niveibacterium sp. SC-1 TaxID=3135646 RepID=UPI00311EB728
MTPTLQAKLIAAMAETIFVHAEELTELDRAIGDGDHGLNMERGFRHVLEASPQWHDKPSAETLKALGTALIMKVGGASGPLYGTLFMSLGKAWPEPLDAAGLAAALASAIAAIEKLGKSEPGQKTMLDVLVPVQEALARGGEGLSARLARCAAEAAERTVPMRAIKGRASFLGERSIGHMDPGARSASLLVAAICGALDTD